MFYNIKNFSQNICIFRKIVLTLQHRNKDNNNIKTLRNFNKKKSQKICIVQKIFVTLQRDNKTKFN